MKTFWKTVIVPTLAWIMLFAPVRVLVEAVSYVTRYECARALLIGWGCFITLVMHKCGVFDRDE